MTKGLTAGFVVHTRATERLDALAAVGRSGAAASFASREASSDGIRVLINWSSSAYDGGSVLTPSESSHSSSSSGSSFIDVRATMTSSQCSVGRPRFARRESARLVGTRNRFNSAADAPAIGGKVRRSRRWVETIARLFSNSWVMRAHAAPKLASVIVIWAIVTAA